MVQLFAVLVLIHRLGWKKRYRTILGREREKYFLLYILSTIGAALIGVYLHIVVVCQLPQDL